MGLVYVIGFIVIVWTLGDLMYEALKRRRDDMFVSPRWKADHQS